MFDHNAVGTKDGFNTIVDISFFRFAYTQHKTPNQTQKIEKIKKKKCAHPMATSGGIPWTT